MVRAMAMEILGRDLAELEQEISMLSDTVELYRHELNKRRANPDKEWGRWQVAPGVAMRAQSALRRLRDRRDKMIAETEAEVIEGAQPQAEAAPASKQGDPMPGREFDWNAVAQAYTKHAPSEPQAAAPSPGRQAGGATADNRIQKQVPA